MKSLPASSFSADSGNGLISRQRTTCSTWPMPRLDCQSFLSVLTQISPAFEMFGWKIFVKKKPLGGAVG